MPVLYKIATPPPREDLGVSLKLYPGGFSSARLTASEAVNQVSVRRVMSRSVEMIYSVILAVLLRTERELTTAILSGLVIRYCEPDSLAIAECPGVVALFRLITISSSPARCAIRLLVFHAPCVRNCHQLQLL